MDESSEMLAIFRNVKSTMLKCSALYGRSYCEDCYTRDEMAKLESRRPCAWAEFLRPNSTVHT